MPSVVDKRIQQLPELLANQIAAGEVVERPASVVKELLENSLDAGATRIEIDIEQGGLRRIRIHDNGCGIHAEDLPLALSRHATSKLETLQDLEQIMSLGFRGEALPSIASVSRLQILTRRADATLASRIDIDELGKHKGVLPAAHPVGTTVVVEDLFCNAPARRRFQRAPRTEFAHVLDVVQRIALASPTTAIQLQHNGRQVLKLSAANDANARLERIGRIFGNDFVTSSLPVSAEADGLQLLGYLAPADLHRAQSDRQYVYINGRMVRDKLMSHAIRQAYGDRLPEGRYAAYVLYLDIDPVRVDVNVHPTKHEVRFRDARSMHDFLFTALHRCLREERSDTTVQEPGRPRLSVVPTTGEHVAQVREPATVYKMPLREVRTINDKQRSLPFGDVVTCMAQRYILCRDDTQHYLVDVQALLQQVYWQRLQQAFQEGGINARPLLVPERFAVSTAQLELLDAQVMRVERLGFEITASGEASALLRRAPVILQQVESLPIVTTLIEALEAGDDNDEVLDVLATAAAAHTRLPTSNRVVQDWLATQLDDDVMASASSWLVTVDGETLASLFPASPDRGE